MSIQNGAAIDAAGKLHELLVGYYINGEHMQKHSDKSGQSPEEAHNTIKDRVSPEEYEQIDNRARAAAAYIKLQFESQKNPIAVVSWTSKPGDIERVTGIKASQHDDPSDIMFTHENATYTGISLKVSYKRNAKVPVSTIGIGTMDTNTGTNGVSNQTNARIEIENTYPELRTFTNKSQRKEFLKNNPAIKTSVDAIHKKHLNMAAREYATVLGNMEPQELSGFLRNHVLHARETIIPHYRFTTGGLNGNYTHNLVQPSTEYNEQFNSPEHFTVQHSGNGIIVKHKGKKFVRLQLKRDSTSDSKSAYKLIGR